MIYFLLPNVNTILEMKCSFSKNNESFVSNSLCSYLNIMKKIQSENIKVNKFWLSKDKFISRFDAEKGPNHWYLKKFIVLYFFILVNRKDVDESTFKEIVNIFSSSLLLGNYILVMPYLAVELISFFLVSYVLFLMHETHLQ